MAVLTVQTIVRAGLEATYAAAAAGGDSFPNDGKMTFFHAVNASAGAIVITFETPGTVDGLAIADRTVSVPAGEDRMIGPFPTAWYDNSVAVTYDGVTSLTVAAISL